MRKRACGRKEEKEGGVKGGRSRKRGGKKGGEKDDNSRSAREGG